MRTAEVDYILTTMLEAYGNISDLNITVGQPFQVETNGKLVEVQSEATGSKDNSVPGRGDRLEPDQIGPAADGNHSEEWFL